MRHVITLTALFISAVSAQAQWLPFFEGAIFGTYASQAGPKDPEHRVMSTNWFAGGVEKTFTRGRILAGGRVSLEPLTIPKDGYPQLFQYISPESGGPLVDRMRAQDLVQELAVAVEWRALRLYAAPVGEPPLGAEPFALRDSSIDFAEAPFAFDVQESFHVATRVVTVGAFSNAVSVEGGVFHNARSTGRHTTIDDGDIDSWGARITVAPHGRVSAHFSTGRLGDNETAITTASIGYNGKRLVASALWAKRASLQSYGLESTVRAGRSSVLSRFEWVDRPGGVFTLERKRMAHITLGYVFDVIRDNGRRAGIGFNVDYHTGTGHLQHDYGHKPQGLFAFVRVRTDRATRRASL